MNVTKLIIPAIVCVVGFTTFDVFFAEDLPLDKDIKIYPGYYRKKFENQRFNLNDKIECDSYFSNYNHRVILTDSTDLHFEVEAKNGDNPVIVLFSKTGCLIINRSNDKFERFHTTTIGNFDKIYLIRVVNSTGRMSEYDLTIEED